MGLVTIIDRSEDNSPYLTLRVAFWVDVPQASRQADPTATSAVTDATPQELSALKSGAVREFVETLRWADDKTDEQMKAILLDRYRYYKRSLSGIQRGGRAPFFVPRLSGDPEADVWAVRGGG
jgi:hypothetical protein